MINTNQDSFAADVLAAELPVVVQFSASWCNPCKAMAPIVDKVEATFTDRAKFVKVDIDESAELRDQFQVRTVPAFLIFRDGDLLSVQPKSATQSQLTRWIEEGLSL